MLPRLRSCGPRERSGRRSPGGPREVESSSPTVRTASRGCERIGPRGALGRPDSPDADLDHFSDPTRCLRIPSGQPSGRPDRGIRSSYFTHSGGGGRAPARGQWVPGKHPARVWRAHGGSVRGAGCGFLRLPRCRRARTSIALGSGSSVRAQLSHPAPWWRREPAVNWRLTVIAAAPTTMPGELPSWAAPSLRCCPCGVSYLASGFLPTANGPVLPPSWVASGITSHETSFAA